MTFLYILMSAALGAAVFIGSVVYAGMPWPYAEAFFFVYIGLLIWMIDDRNEDREIQRLAVSHYEREREAALAQAPSQRAPRVYEGESETVRRERRRPSR